MLLNFLSMPRMHRLLPPLFISGFLLIASACKKELPPTAINGKVTDKRTGEPIEGASIYLEFHYESIRSGSLVTETDAVSLKTDSKGEFHHTQDSDFDGAFSDVYKAGYVGQFLKFTRGQENNLDIKLAPRDGALRLEIYNETGQFDSVYVIVTNPSCIAGYGSLGKIFLGKFPVVLSTGQNYESYFKLPSEEFTKISWSFVNPYPYYLPTPFQDSVYLTLNDTTDFVISF